MGNFGSSPVSFQVLVQVPLFDSNVTASFKEAADFYFSDSIAKVAVHVTGV